MRLGGLLGPVSGNSPPRFLEEQARTFAGEGFDSIWSIHALSGGFRMTDPFIALGIAATAAPNVEIGTAVVQVSLYHPMDLAHRILSLRQICGERLIVGVGVGSTPTDATAFERDFSARFKQFPTRVAALRDILRSGGNADVTFAPWESTPAAPPPLFLGSWGRGVERAAREFDGWIASAYYRSQQEIIEALGRYRQAGGGRAVVSTIQLSADTDPGELRERLARYAEAGFDDAVVLCTPGGPAPGAVRRLLDA